MRDDNASRYQHAAEVALEQIDWCIKYLHQIRKTDVARILSRNRAHIDRRMRERPASEVDGKH